MCFRGWQKDYRHDKKRGSNVYCWFIHNSGKGFIDGHYTDYIVPNLNSFLRMLWAAGEAFKYPVLLLNLPCVSTVVKRWRRVRDVDTSWLLRLLFRRQKSHLLNLFGENCSTCTSIQNKTKKQIEYIVLCDSTLALHCVIYLCMYICTGESWESNSDTVESLSLSGRLRLKVVGSGQFWEILIGDVDSLPLLLTLKTTKEDTLMRHYTLRVIVFLFIYEILVNTVYLAQPPLI